MDLESKFDCWKKNLLDLGKRNSLINFKLDSKSVLRIIRPSISILYRKVVEDEEPILIPCAKETDYGGCSDGAEEELFECNGYCIKKNPEDALKVLRSLRKKYRTFVNEQDVNVLYLSFGFLEWKEESNSRQELVSPLILVPVSIHCDSIKSPIEIQVTDDEIVVNPTLAYKLKNDFGVDLPEFSDDGFEIVYEKLSKFARDNGWALNDSVCLSILSFLKINMYKDLERHRDLILRHPIVNALGGDQAALEKNMEMAGGLNGYDHDSLRPSEVFDVVDADSSQQDAILYANNGISFVLQGPPGTGKSQTITNIIASKIAQGKKVLFVSEKKAALDVVFKRLESTGLSDFALILHGAKEGKRETLAQLENTLLLARDKVTLSDGVEYELDKLFCDRKRLNAYAREVNEIIPPLNKSIFYANGEIVRLSNIEDVVFSVPDVRNTSEEGFRSYMDALQMTSRQLERMDGDPLRNPWHDTNIRIFTNEFVHGFGERKDAILSGLEKLESLCGDFADSMKLDIDMTFNGVKRLMDLLYVAKDSPIVPENWIGETEKLKEVVKNGEALVESYDELVGVLSESVSEYKKLNQGFCVFKLDDIHTLADADNAIRLIQDHIDANPCFSALKKDVAKIACVYKNEELVKECIDISNVICNVFKPGIASVDARALKTRFERCYGAFSRIFKPSYWKDRKLIRDQMTNSKNYSIGFVISSMGNLVKKEQLLMELKSQSEQISAMFPFDYKDLETDFGLLRNEIRKFQEISKILEVLKQMRSLLADVENQEPHLKALLRDRYDGIRTEWGEIGDALCWVERFESSLAKYDGRTKSADGFAASVLSEPDCVKYVSCFYDSLNDHVDDCFHNADWFFKKFENPTDFLDCSFEKIRARLMDCANNFEGLENWIDYSDARNRMTDLGLSDYLEIIESRPICSKMIIPVFKKRFFRLWVDSVLPDYQAVAKFRHANHEDLIREFSSFDKKQFVIARAKIRARLINSLPALDNCTSGEVNVLRSELRKQKRIMPIRKLFSRIPNLLMALKPCLMMSPLSISQFLESEIYQFDTVIFDEASQVRTENAIGAIFRAKQAIIAGDSHQLPPTNFFNVQIGDDDFDEDLDDECSETSVLEEAIFFPSRELLWHYRSRHEELIAFSNAKIYKNRLITFPSDKERMPGWGVEYVFVENGIYEGRQKGNVIEAEKVAQEVFKHIREYPNRTLGVIAFGTSQEFAIENAINRMRKEHPEFEDFFMEDKSDPFFVKNLENVQGDERDTIIFSIGYAKDRSGKMSMRFGPLSMAGGEKRLNVAITRAKFNIKLIGSIAPTDIDVERVTQDGPKLLQKYIEFAMEGEKSIIGDTGVSDAVEFDSPFESSVFDFLVSQGYSVSAKVGCSGYKIDLGVKHPDCNGYYVLGIECDGATYHSSRTARERDRLRQDVLEQMGWNIYRIWSTDWRKDIVTEKQRLLKAVKNAIDSFGSDDFDCKGKSNGNGGNLENLSDIIHIENKPSDTESNYGFKEYVICDFSKSATKTDDHNGLLAAISDVVEVEGPLHFDLLCQRISFLFDGKQKVTPMVKNSVRRIVGLSDADSNGLIMKGNFIYAGRALKSKNVRVAGPRQIDQISLDELSDGVEKVVLSNIGLTKQELLHETARAFGFKRMGSNITERLNKAIDCLIDSNRISIKDDKIVIGTPVLN